MAVAKVLNLILRWKLGGDCTKPHGLLVDVRSLLASAIVSGVVLGEKRCSGISIVRIVGRASGDVAGSIDRIEWINRWSRIRTLVYLSHCDLPKTEKADEIEVLEGRTGVLVGPMAGVARRNCVNCN